MASVKADLKHKCAAKNCLKGTFKTGKRLFRFPKDAQRLTKRRHNIWMLALGRDPAIETYRNSYNAVCSNHFLESDIITDRAKLRVYLRENAIPRLKLKKIDFTCRSKRAKTWVIAAGREDLLNKVDTLYNEYRICGAHFEKKFFLTPECNKLLADAKPTIFQHSAEQHIVDHTYSQVETKRLESILSLENEDSSTLDETITSTSDNGHLLLHHEIDIKTEPVSSTSFQNLNTISTQTTKTESTSDNKQEKSMQRQIEYLKKDNYRLIRQIKELDDQLAAKRKQILKTLTVDEFQNILNNYKDPEEQTELDNLNNETNDVVVKVEDAAYSEDVVVKMEDAAEWEDAIVKVENAVTWEDDVVKVESEDVEDTGKFEEVFVKMETE